MYVSIIWTSYNQLETQLGLKLILHHSNCEIFCRTIYNLLYNWASVSLFVCLFVCPAVWKKINVTSVASVEPGKSRERIGITILRKITFCKMKFHQMKFTKWSSPNEVHQMKFRKINKFCQKRKKKSFSQKICAKKHIPNSWRRSQCHMWPSHMFAAD